MAKKLGVLQSEHLGTLFKCRMCEVYCISCKYQNKLMHVKHRKHIKSVTVKDFLSENGQYYVLCDTGWMI